MLESIYVGMTGLLGYSRGLRVIANNTANMNTPGFKSSSLQFADMFYTGGNLSGGVTSQNNNQLGFGLNTTGTTMSFKQGELRQTGNEFDMAVDGQGLFVLKGADGNLVYTRAGQFRFDADGVLVSRSTGEKVMGQDGNGQLVEISVAGQMTQAGKATTRVKLSGNLSSTATEQEVGNINVLDAMGGSHTLTLKFTNTDSVETGSWSVDVMDGTTVLSSGRIVFADGRPVGGTAIVQATYSPPGQPPMALSLDFSSDVTSFASGNLSTLAMTFQDGVGPGTLSGVAFDANGVLTISYSNGESRKGARIALARFDSQDAVAALGDNQFRMLDARAWHFGVAGEGAFGNVRTGAVEISNVDLSQEFSDLVVMQRGYQASSQVISTANDMLQELFSMKSR
jgi:flagellar hook protein FlgE